MVQTRAGSGSEPIGSVSELAGRAPVPAERALEPDERALWGCLYGATAQKVDMEVRSWNESREWDWS